MLISNLPSTYPDRALFSLITIMLSQSMKILHQKIYYHLSYIKFNSSNDPNLVIISLPYGNCFNMPNLIAPKLVTLYSFENININPLEKGYSKLQIQANMFITNLFFSKLNVASCIKNHILQLTVSEANLNKLVTLST